MCAFLDISKAFDSVRHSDVFECMENRGVSRDTIAMLKAMYYKGASRIIISGHLSEKIEIKRGVRQGGSTSPIVFNFIPNELAWMIEEANIGIKVGDPGINVGLLLYADDIVLLAGTEIDLQKLCDICGKWAEKYSLEANQQKSVVVDYSLKPQKLIVRISGEFLKQTDQLSILGKS
ncbi:unnamed protein product [Blepharisma stoltei]|uniref:Reverse transcriptase domain-containing protein n=1 Tax=Blepharisma stoltei TaxID=1481888 RepID=A0AAU9J513_9CILI|nr:unnamed protein product [Blepharisma stoltei]